jgi:hypothetical protein
MLDPELETLVDHAVEAFVSDAPQPDQEVNQLEEQS